MDQNTQNMITELCALAYWLSHGMITKQEAIHRMQAIQEEHTDDQEVRTC